MIILFDTNVLISLMIFPKSKPRKSLNKALKFYDVIASQDTTNEFIDKINNKKFDKYIDLSDRIIYFEDYFSQFKEIEITIKVNDCRDPKDNKFLELALSGKADYIISGDTDLLILNPYHNIKIVTPAEFLELA